MSKSVTLYLGQTLPENRSIETCIFEFFIVVEVFLCFLVVFINALKKKCLFLLKKRNYQKTKNSLTHPHKKNEPLKLDEADEPKGLFTFKQNLQKKKQPILVLP